MIQPNFKIKPEKESAYQGLFVFEPLDQGYGHTLGNSLRRVMLTSIPGYAISQVKIKGVTHRFTSLEGMKEDVVDFVLNLKEVRLKVELEADEDISLELEAKGPGAVTAGDLKTPTGVEVVNPDLIIATLAEKKNTLEASMKVEKGTGYRSYEEVEIEEVGVVPLDCIFSPVVLVNYKVESTRVGRRTDFDQLIMEVKTDGTLAPKKAIETAAKILMSHFEQVIEPTFEEKEEKKPARVPEEYRLTVEELNLPTRIANALRKGGYKTVKDLAEATADDISKVKNIGKKSVKTIAKRLAEKDVEFKEE